MTRVCALVLVALVLQFSAAQIMDLSFIDPFYYLYNLQHNNNFNNAHNNILNNNNNGESNFIDDFHQQPLRGCLSYNQNLQGTCMASHECKYSRGFNSGKGNCTYLHSCCTYSKTCNETVRARVVYFQNPTNPRSRTSPCTLRLQLLNEDICQIRVDIDQLDLEETPPPPVDPEPNPPTMIAVCREYITVNPAPAETIPQICSTSANSHFYIHLNNPNSGFVDINVLLQQVAGLTSSGTWNMRLTQLECPGRINKKSSFNHKKRNENQAADDFGELAPAGCTQYYTQQSGVVHDLGARTSLEEFRSACFKRFPNTCGITFSLPADITTPEMCTDYFNSLNIQYPVDPMIDAAYIALICGQPAPFRFTLPYPGPYWIAFRNQEMRDDILNYVLAPCPATRMPPVP